MKKVKTNPVLEITMPPTGDFEQVKRDLDDLLEELQERNYLLPGRPSSWKWGFRGQITHSFKYVCESCGTEYDEDEQDLVALDCAECGTEVCDWCCFNGEYEDTLCQECYLYEQGQLAEQANKERATREAHGEDS